MKKTSFLIIFSALCLFTGSRAAAQDLPKLRYTTADGTVIQLSKTVTDGTMPATGNQGEYILNVTSKKVFTWNGTKWIETYGIFKPHCNPNCDDNSACIGLWCFKANVLSDDDIIVEIDDDDDKASIIMKPVTGGVFYMGFDCKNSSNPNYDSENGWCSSLTANKGVDIVHKAAVNSFYMSETEITQKQFKEVVGGSPTWDRGAGDYYPAYNVSWYDAITFCNKLSIMEGREPYYEVSGVDFGSLAYAQINTNANDAEWNNPTRKVNTDGYRLPTEAEWEYAARGGQKNEYTRTLGQSGTQYLYSGSNTIGDVAWYNNGTSNAQEVKKKNPNDLKLYDMTGNLWEWCWDWFGGYEDCCIENPDTPDTSNGKINSVTNRVNRGGCWDNQISYCRVSYRGTSHNSSTRGHWMGFRIVCNAGE
jgi:formylglycine-generating enzyme required for sulfatase activity